MASQVRAGLGVNGGKTWGPSGMEKGSPYLRAGREGSQGSPVPAQVTVQGPKDKASGHPGG